MGLHNLFKEIILTVRKKVVLEGSARIDKSGCNCQDGISCEETGCTTIRSYVVLCLL